MFFLKRHDRRDIEERSSSDGSFKGSVNILYICHFLLHATLQLDFLPSSVLPPPVLPSPLALLRISCLFSSPPFPFPSLPHSSFLSPCFCLSFSFLIQPFLSSPKIRLLPLALFFFRHQKKVNERRQKNGNTSYIYYFSYLASMYSILLSSTLYLSYSTFSSSISDQPDASIIFFYESS